MLINFLEIHPQEIYFSNNRLQPNQQYKEKQIN
jgi:hypothetical protein